MCSLRLHNWKWASTNPKAAVKFFTIQHWHSKRRRDATFPYSVVPNLALEPKKNGPNFPDSSYLTSTETLDIPCPLKPKAPGIIGIIGKERICPERSDAVWKIEDCRKSNSPSSHPRILVEDVLHTSRICLMSFVFKNSTWISLRHGTVSNTLQQYQVMYIWQTLTWTCLRTECQDIHHYDRDCVN